MSDILPAILYRPADVSQLTLQTIEEFESNKAARVPLTPIDEINSTLKAARPGELITIVALSSNWKTGFMQCALRNEAARLDPAGNECVLYVTYEVSIEECGMLDVANEARIDVGDIIDGNIQDWSAIKSAAIRRGAMPIYVIGNSIARRKERAKLTMTDVSKAAYIMENTLGLRIKLAAVDYLQIIPAEGARSSDERRIQVAANTQRCKDMAFALGCPVMIGCQAKQELYDRDWKLPRMNDGMETSGIMHITDKMIGLWRPWVTDPGGMIGEPEFKVTEDMLIVGVPKQRFGEVGKWWPLNVDFSRNEIRGLIDMKLLEL